MAIGGAFFGGPTARSQSKVFVEFNAGKLNLNPTTKMVSPDKRKGMLTVLQCDDQLMHLQWKDRITGTIEEDLIIYPDDVEFKWVPACTTGRVFVLKFKTSNKRMFFWMQEPHTTTVTDEWFKEFLQHINKGLLLVAEREALQSKREALKSRREALQSEEEALQSEEEALKSEKEALKCRKEALKSEKEALKSRDEALECRMEALKSEVKAGLEEMIGDFMKDPRNDELVNQLLLLKDKLEKSSRDEEFVNLLLRAMDLVEKMSGDFSKCPRE